MKQKLAILLALILSLSMVISACGSKEPSPSEDTSAVQSSEESSEDTTTEETSPEDTAGMTLDREGNEFLLPETVDSIISFAPAITHVIIDLGMEDALIAVDSQSQMMFPEVEDLPAFDMLAPEPEQIIQMEPDLVLVSNLTAQGGESPFISVQEAGVSVAGIASPNTVADIGLDVQFIADCIGKTKEGQDIVATMMGDIEEIRTIAQTIQDKKTVYFEISALPDLYSFGTDVFLNELIEILGAENIFADQESWIPVSEESIIEKNPDVILTNIDYMEDPVSEILGREGWESITAIQEKAVYQIDANASSQPNQHIVEALQEMAAAVYPEHFA